MTKTPSSFLILLTAVTGLILTSCGGDIKKEAKYPRGLDGKANEGDIYSGPGSIFGDEGLSILGGKKDDDDGNGGSGIGVNSFLWRASLDTVSFMPLASADPFGGVIITDWYQPNADVGERFKVNVLILGRSLRSDGIRVRSFKQKLKGKAWVDAAVGDDTSRQLEDAILTRARQLRISQFETEE